MRAQITGLKRLRAKIDRLEDKIDITGQQVLETIATRMIERIAWGMAKSPPTGRTYNRYKPRRVHTASAASGSAYPRLDRKRLLRSIKKKTSAKKKKVSVYTYSPYAKTMEYGDLTRNIAPRPFFYRSYRSAVRTVAAELRKNYEILR